MKRQWLPGIIWLCASIAQPALADGTGTPSDFTFKRIGPPKPGTTNRITVQIDPAVQEAWMAGLPDDVTEPADADGAVPAPAANGFEWFWDKVSPNTVSGGPANLQLALATLKDNSVKLSPPRLQRLQDIAAAHGIDILKATIGTDISPALVLAVIAVESGGREDAVSGAGAEGLMQLIPATAERFGVADSTVAEDNIKGGVAYLDWLMKTFDGDPILALAGYNAGENAVRDNNGVPPFAETRAYVPKVLAAWQVARGLCQTPPELITDGCVFMVRGNGDNG